MSLSELLNNPVEIKELQRMLDDFCDLTGLAAVVSDPQGQMLTELSNGTEFCKNMRRVGDLCAKSDEMGGRIAADLNKICIYKCHAGLIDFAVPIFIDNTHMGNILAGQARSALTFQVDLSETHFQTKSGLSEEQKKLFDEISFVDQEWIKKSSRILTIIQKYINERINALRYQRKENAENPQLSHFNEFKSRVKNIAECIENVKYDVGKSLLKDLVNQFIVNSQMTLTTKLYWSIYYYELINLEVQIQEKEVLKSSFIGESVLGRQYFELYDKVFDFVIKHRIYKISDEMNYAIAYIQRYYFKKINNNLMAEYMNLSPDYLAKIFKGKYGISIVAYSTRYKVEQAMKLLLNTDLTIQVIAIELGFNESNYFSKVFKKEIGMTPSMFRYESRNHLIQHVNKITE